MFARKKSFIIFFRNTTKSSSRGRCGHDVLNFLNSPMTRTLEEGDKKIREKDDERHKLELKTTEDFLCTKTFRD